MTEDKNSSSLSPRLTSTRTIKVLAKVPTQPDKDNSAVLSQCVRLTFRKTTLLGAGCFGIVFGAKVLNVAVRKRINGSDEEETVDAPEQNVALKIVVVKQKRENRELSILRQLDHPHIVRLLYYYFRTSPSAEDNEPCEQCLNLVFEQLPTTLFDVLEICPMAEPEALFYMNQLFSALAYLHGSGVCHRDIKPKNILLNPRSRVLKLCDFGSAKHIFHRSDRNWSYICSRFYRAPELLLGAEHYDSSVDLWSCGCILAEMLTGEPLFRGESAMGQLVEVISALGPPNQCQVDEMLEETEHHFALDDVLLLMESPRIIECDPVERIRIAMKVEEETNVTTIRLIAELLQYIPRLRPSAEELLERRYVS